jgi:ABC-2 type transport system ATP-binding protein
METMTLHREAAQVTDSPESERSAKVLEIEGVRKSYDDVEALVGVDLDLAPGEILGLIGPNGAGKTTLVSIVAGLLRPDAGSVRVGGLDVQREPMRVHGMLGIAPQELGLYVQQTVRKNLRFFGTLAGLPATELENRIAEVADALDLTDLLDRRAQNLSGGEKRRAHTAVALLPRPPLLLLDEPTAGVDVHTRTRILEVLKRLAQDGVAICYATHYLQEIEALEASVAILEQGRIVARGSVAELVAASGGAVVEIRFDCPVPAEFVALGNVDDDGTVLRVDAPDPSAALPRTLASVEAASERIVAVEMVRPSLESVYLGITGRRFEPGGTESSQ